MPFTREQFFEVFRRYNEAVWPTQVLLLGLGLAAACLAFRRRSLSDRFIVTALAVLWTWMGVVYHFRYFRPINPAASVFGILFVLEAILLLWSGLVPGTAEIPGLPGLARNRGWEPPGLRLRGVSPARQELRASLSRESHVRASVPDNHCDARSPALG